MIELLLNSRTTIIDGGDGGSIELIFGADESLESDPSTRFKISLNWTRTLWLFITIIIIITTFAYSCNVFISKLIPMTDTDSRRKQFNNHQND